MARPRSSGTSSASPSAWSERWRPLALAAVGLAIAAYLTAFQVRLVGSVWEPFFGSGSRTILTSSVARALPIPDASLGMAAYLADLVLGFVGGPARWRTMPWIVFLFGAVVGLAGLTSLLLVVAQAAIIHAWCTLCLASAAISLGIVPLAWPEVRAALGHVRQLRAGGAPLAIALRGSSAEDPAATGMATEQEG